MSEPLITMEEAADIIAYGEELVVDIIADHEPEHAIMVLCYVVAETMLRLPGHSTMSRLEIFDEWVKVTRGRIEEAQSKPS